MVWGFQGLGFRDPLQVFGFRGFMVCGLRFQVSWFMVCGLGRCRHSLDLRRPFETRLERLELRVRVEGSINVVVCGFFRV